MHLWRKHVYWNMQRATRLSNIKYCDICEYESKSCKIFGNHIVPINEQIGNLGRMFEDPAFMLEFWIEGRLGTCQNKFVGINSMNKHLWQLHDDFEEYWESDQTFWAEVFGCLSNVRAAEQTMDLRLETDSHVFFDPDNWCGMLSWSLDHEK